MKETGGYAVRLDQAIPEDAPLENFRFYCEYVKSVANY